MKRIRAEHVVLALATPLYAVTLPWPMAALGLCVLGAMLFLRGKGGPGLPG